MRRLAFVPLLLVAVAAAQTRYRVSQNGKDLGEARLSQRLSADGGKTSEMAMTLRRMGQVVTVRTVASFDRDGLPLRKLMEIAPEGKPPSRQVIASFDGNGASVVVKVHSVPKTQRVPLNDGAKRPNPFELWFVRERPAPGTKVLAYVFNLDTLDWDLTTVTYVGPVKDGHRILMERADRRVETVVDDKGVPVSITDSTGLQMTRLGT